MKPLILMMPLLAAGCANYAFNTNLDKKNFDDYFKPGRVEIYQQTQLAELDYLYLGTVEGQSCQENAQQPLPKVAEARTEARNRVADMGGNGVSFDRCSELENTPACLRQIVCYGQALKVAQPQ